MKKILLIGKNGLVSKCLINTLNESCEILAIGRDDSEKLDSILNNSQYQFDSVIYSAQSPDYKSPHFTQNLFAVNLELLFKVLDKLRKRTSQFIYFSTGSVYKPTLDKISEDSPLNNFSGNPYIASKMAAEELINCFDKEFESLVILRPFFIYGKDQNVNMLFQQIKRKITSGEIINLASGIGMAFNPIYVNDIASLVQMLVLKNNAGKLTINAFGPDVIALSHVIKAFEESLKLKANISITNDAPASWVATSKFHFGCGATRCIEQIHLI